MKLELQTLDAFLQSHSLTRRVFYSLMRRGEAPETLVIGRRRYVSDTAAAAWRERYTRQQAA
jgi:hypothetical protein